jgi:hypothetical protein
MRRRESRTDGRINATGTMSTKYNNTPNQATADDSITTRATVWNRKFVWWWASRLLRRLTDSRLVTPRQGRTRLHT